jgi:hypothetical protein
MTDYKADETMVKAFKRAQDLAKISEYLATFAAKLGLDHGYDIDLIREAAFHWLAEDHSRRDDFIEEAEDAVDGVLFEDDEDDEDE